VLALTTPNVAFTRHKSKSDLKRIAISGFIAILIERAPAGDDYPI